MKPTLAILALLGVAVAFFLALPHASAGANAPGTSCALVSVSSAGSARTYLTSDDATATSCITNPAKIEAGKCKTFNLIAVTSGSAPPASATGVNVYFFPSLATGHASYANPIKKFAFGAAPATQSFTMCMTVDGLAASPARWGPMDLVIRICDYAGPTGDGCAGTASVYDGDSAGAGTGAFTFARWSGITNALAHVATITDSNANAGTDVSTYVPGDKVWGQMTFTEPLWASGDPKTITVAIARTSGGSPLGGSPNWQLSLLVPAGASTTAWAGSLVAINLGDAWVTGDNVYFTAADLFFTAPPGFTLASGTLTGSVGTIDKTLTATCTLRDPVTLAAALSPAKLNRAEQAQCRGTGTGGQATIKNGRNENWPAGAFVSAYARRETQPPQDTSDAPRCDVTTSTAGVYQCDITLASSTYANNARIAGATQTTGLAYGVDVAIYADSARTTLLARGHVANLFDVRSDDNTIATSTGALACNVGPTSSLSVAQRGETETLTYRLCNPRGETIAPTTTVDGTRTDTYVVDQPATSLAPTAGTYSWSFTTGTSPGSYQHTLTGYAKRLNVTDGNGNNATADLAWNVTDLTPIASFHTWLKSCAGPETSLFVAGADTICANEGPVTSARGTAWTAPKTFVRWYNDTSDNGQIPSDQESSVTSGTSSPHTIVPQPPAGSWTFTVRAYDSMGNYGEATKSVTFVSPLTSIYDILCSGTNIRVAPGETMSAVCTTMKRDPQTYILQASCPDAAPYYRVNSTLADGTWTTSVPTTTPAVDSASGCSYWVNWTVPSDWLDGRPAELLLQANMTGAPIHAYYPLNVEAVKGTDPMFVVAEYSWDTHKATVSVSLKLGNGTSRPGLASSLAGVLYGPDDGASVASLTFTERAQTGTYYARVDLGVSPVRGTWLVLVDAPQPTGSAHTTFTTTFTIRENATLAFLDARNFNVAFWASMNASLLDLAARVDQARAEQNLTRDNLTQARGDVASLRADADARFAYTNDLVNATNAQGAGARTLNLTWASDGDAYVCWAGRSCRIQANSTSTSGRYGGLYWTMDLGDENTTTGDVVYHRYRDAGSYTLTARLTDALGGSNVTTRTILVPTSAPTLNVTGPTVVRPGHEVTFTVGSSRDLHDDVAYTFVEDPRLAHVWYVGDKWTNGGYCGPLNVTSIGAPDINGLQLGPFQSQWTSIADESCAQLNATFLVPGPHDVLLIGVNAHGVERHLDYPIMVLPYSDVMTQHPYHPGDNALPGVDAKGFTDQTSTAIKNVVRFIHWITGHG